MNSTAEQHFVQAFVRKKRRERLLYELMTPQKRYNGISRFCHQAKDLLDPSRIIMEGDDLDLRPEFARFVQQHDENCLVLSPAIDPDGEYLRLEDAVGSAMVCPDAVLIMGSTFAIVFGEPMKSGRDKILLEEEIKKEK